MVPGAVYEPDFWFFTYFLNFFTYLFFLRVLQCYFIFSFISGRFPHIYLFFSPPIDVWHTQCLEASRHPLEIFMHVVSGLLSQEHGGGAFGMIEVASLHLSSIVNVHFTSYVA